MPHDVPRAVIDIHELTVRYGSFTAVDRLSLEVQQGEIFGFLGPNGAGKTTTIKVLTGQLPFTLGRVTVAGCDVRRMRARLRRRFGYVPDRDNHIEELTAEQNLDFFRRLYGTGRERVSACLSELDLTRERHLSVRSFSAGMKKKLLIARAMLHDPEVYFFDEPTTNLDVSSAERVRDSLRKRALAGSTVFLTSHDMKEVVELCDRVAILKAGRLLLVESPRQLLATHARHRVSVRIRSESGLERKTLNLNQDADRAELAALVGQGVVEHVQSLDADFSAVFAQLTGDGP